MVIFSKQVDHVAVEVVNKLDPNVYYFNMKKRRIMDVDRDMRSIDCIEIQRLL